MKVDDRREREIILKKVDSLVSQVRFHVTLESTLSNLKSEIQTILPNYPDALTAAERTELSSNATILQEAIDLYKAKVAEMTINR